jgi:hypothetical protein
MEEIFNAISDYVTVCVSNLSDGLDTDGLLHSVLCDTYLKGKHSATRSHGSWHCAVEANENKTKSTIGNHLTIGFKLSPASLAGLIAREAYSPRSRHDTAHAAVVESPSIRLPSPLTDAIRNTLPTKPDAATTT